MIFLAYPGYAIFTTHGCSGECNGGSNTCTLQALSIGFHMSEWNIFVGSLADKDEMLSGGPGVYSYWAKQPDNNKICPEMGSAWNNNLVTTCVETFTETTTARVVKMAYPGCY